MVEGAVLALKFREDVSDAAAAQIAAQYVNLRVVDLSGCVQVTDVSIVAMAESCPWLKSVDLSGKDGWNPSKITDASIGALVGSCPLLESVHLAWCTLLTDASIVAFAGSCPLLKSLGGFFTIGEATFNGESGLTDAIIDQVMLRPEAAELKSVNLRGCKLLTDVSIVPLAGSCPLLKSVNLWRCKLLTDVSVGALAGSCPLLESVNLTFCKLLTDASIVAFAGSCPLLKSVDLGGRRLITHASIAALKAALPDVSVHGR